MSEPERSIEELDAALKSACGGVSIFTSVEYGDLIVSVPSSSVLHVLRACKESPSLQFNMLVDLTVVDWLDSREDRFEVVYQLLSLNRQRRLTVKVSVREDVPEIDSAVQLWAGANFLEREAWDMFGIRFKGHPDLRRILLYEEFQGHPLRKDYPVQAKQPRIPLRKPEVENTARNMRRPELVRIRSKRERSDDVRQG